MDDRRELPLGRIRRAVLRDRWLVGSGTVLMCVFAAGMVIGLVAMPGQNDWHWWSYLMVIGIALVLALGFAGLTFGQVRFPASVRRSLLAARTPDAELTVVAIDRPPRPDPGEDSPDPDITLHVRDAAGACWTWTLEWFWPELVEVGDTVPVVGQPAEGAYLVGLTPERLLMPRRALHRP